MAALDFGMALSRGLVPKDVLAQEDLLNLAGGRNVFKSEDWWNKQVTQQVKEGYRQPSYTTYFLTRSGTYQPGSRSLSNTNQSFTDYKFEFPRDALGYADARDFRDPQGIYRLESLIDTNDKKYRPALDVSAESFGMPALSPANLAKTDPKTNRLLMKVETSFDRFKRVPLNAPELERITAESKRGTEQLKKESAEKKSSSRRLARATAGLVAKARVEGEAPLTGLPALGEGGLGITGSILGGGIKL